MKKMILIIAILAIGVGGYFYLSNPKHALEDNTPVTEGSMQKQEEQNGGPSMNMPLPGNDDADEMVVEDDNAMESDNTPEGEVKEFVVSGKNFEYDITEMRVNKGDTVRVVFTSASGFHDWVVDEFDNARTSRLNDGGTDTIEFVADKTGNFEYYCSVGSHRALGMVGTLIVE